MMFDNTALNLVKADKLRALGVWTRNRLAVMPACRPYRKLAFLATRWLRGKAWWLALARRGP